MKLLTGINTSGNRWRLEVEGVVDGMFMRCDRLVTCPSVDSYSLDCGSLEVIEVPAINQITVEACDGWVPTWGHVIKRKSHCECSCHWRR